MDINALTAQLEAQAAAAPEATVTPAQAAPVTIQAQAKARPIPAPAAPQAEYEPGEFTAQMDTLKVKTIESYRDRMLLAFADRIVYERTKPKDSTKIVKNLEKVAQRLTSEIATKVLLAADVPAEFVNREHNTGNRFNIYALDKLADLIVGVTSGVFENKVNNAIVRSLFTCRAAEISFTPAVQLACASNEVRVSAGIDKFLTRHSMSAATAPTQKSSTLSALELLGVVSDIGDGRQAIYQLKANPIVRRLEAKL